MTVEEKLAGWTGPSSPTEQDKQDRTERMIQDAIGGHAAFRDCRLSVFAKGSYANNTNVRSDSDVDVAVQCHEAQYYEEHTPGARSLATPYSGPWTPTKLRRKLVCALENKFGDQVDTSGTTAIRVTSSTARVEADVVPCFDFVEYFGDGSPGPARRSSASPRTGSRTTPSSSWRTGERRTAPPATATSPSSAS